MLTLARIQYQPTKNKQLTDAQEVKYTREFKRADIAGNFRNPRVQKAKQENK